MRQHRHTAPTVIPVVTVLLLAVVLCPAADRTVNSGVSPPAWTATWRQPIWGLPNGLLPAGPVQGNGDFGMTLQTNNRTGCIEYWLGLNSFWGIPPGVDNPTNQLNPAVAFPSQETVGTVRLCVLDSAFVNASFFAEQRFADSVVTARYTTATNRTLTSRSLMHPVSKLLVTELELSGFEPGEVAPRLSLESWTNTLWRNATAAAAATSTGAGWNASSATHWFSRVAIPTNTASMVKRQLRVVVGTKVGSSGTGGAATSNWTAITNASHADARVGVKCVITPGDHLKVTLVTAAATQLDLGDSSGSDVDFTADPLPHTLALLEHPSTCATTVATANTAYWRAYWGRASVSLPSQPNLERFWYVAQYMLSSVTRPSPARYGGSSFPGLWGPWATAGWRPDPWGESIPWGGAYIIDYNTEGVLYGASSSNKLEQLSSYQDLITAFLPTARTGALATAKWASANFANRNASLLKCVEDSPNALHFPCGIAPFGIPSGDNGPSPGEKRNFSLY
jgi:hypothetical protein